MITTAPIVANETTASSIQKIYSCESPVLIVEAVLLAVVVEEVDLAVVAAVEAEAVVVGTVTVVTVPVESAVVDSEALVGSCGGAI